MLIVKQFWVKYVIVKQFWVQYVIVKQTVLGAVWDCQTVLGAVFRNWAPWWVLSSCSGQNSSGCPSLPELQVDFSLSLRPPCAQEHSELTSLVHPWASHFQQSLWGPQCWL